MKELRCAGFEGFGFINFTPVGLGVLIAAMA
jgi:hypothetical protein